MTASASEATRRVLTELTEQILEGLRSLPEKERDDAQLDLVAILLEGSGQWILGLASGKPADGVTIPASCPAAMVAFANRMIEFGSDLHEVASKSRAYRILIGKGETPRLDDARPRVPDAQIRELARALQRPVGSWDALLNTVERLMSEHAQMSSKLSVDS
jgi:hypothetical protein